MPLIMPIRDLKNTAEISKKCNGVNEPIFITKNGYGDMVLMNMRMYEETMAQLQASKLINESLQDVANGQPAEKVEDFFARMRQKYGE